MKIISIIPARGGSKRIPEKNIKPLAGKPLIVYTIEEALKSEKIERVIVSTENLEITEISEKSGAEVIKRPKELAEDKTPMIDVIFNVMNQLKDDYDDSIIIVLLQPTSPLRSAGDIDNCLDIILKNDCESVVSVYEISFPPYWVFEINKGYLTPKFGMKYIMMERGDFKKSYLPNGALYVASFETLCKYKSFYCKRTIPYIMSFEKSIDIDNEIDFILTELLMKKFRQSKDF
ncbi:MAG: cytidylyltransferase domain-containing protein [Promethearchaeota archaeon]